MANTVDRRSVWGAFLLYNTVWSTSTLKIICKIELSSHFWPHHMHMCANIYAHVYVSQCANIYWYGVYA